VSVIVGEDGSIKTARLMDDRSEKSRLCGKFAEEAAKRRRFHPAKDAAGTPVDSRPMAMSVTFEKPNL
jgi:hypothetical protein